jgi:hypothetical protein
MAVTLSSDLIMDVMRSANPARVEQAMTKLRDMGDAKEAPTEFAETVDALERFEISLTGPVLSLPFAEGRSAAREAETPYQGFERMLLRNLFEALLPDTESGAFGSGPSAGVWRSMAADQMASVYTEAGGTGIARILEERSGSISAQQGQWPYFRAGQISDFTG